LREKLEKDCETTSERNEHEGKSLNEKVKSKGWIVQCSSSPYEFQLMLTLGIFAISAFYMGQELNASNKDCINLYLMGIFSGMSLLWLLISFVKENERKDEK
jgi:hypothetical protein